MQIRWEAEEWSLSTAAGSVVQCAFDFDAVAIGAGDFVADALDSLLGCVRAMKVD